MAKVIVERPRVHGGASYPRSVCREGRRVSMEELQKREGIRRPWLKGRYKLLNENLAPLRRFLQANVGRPWNKVYSEVCQGINRNSAVQLHVWQHLTWEVCTNPYEIHGLINRYWPPSFRFFVDPKTGLLRENKKWRQRWSRPSKTAEPVDRIAIDDSHECRLLDGIWYELELAALPGNENESVFDIVLKKRWPHLSREKFREFYGREVYAVRKCQLNTKEIRRLPAAK